jgi:hypothetical protein
MLLRIPEDDEEVLAELTALPADRLESILQAVRDVSPESPLSRFAGAIEEKTGLDSALSGRVARFLVDINGGRVSRGEAPDAFLAALIEGMKASSNERLSHGHPEKLEGFLRRVLTPPLPLQLAGKIRELRYERENRFCTARVISEIRPVFGDDLDAGPLATLILHTLRISVHCNDSAAETKDIFFSLRGSDLKQLRDLLERAIKKDVVLSAAAKKIRQDARES